MRHGRIEGLDKLVEHCMSCLANFTPGGRQLASARRRSLEQRAPRAAASDDWNEISCRTLY
jgi:hypothetical protein